MQGKYKRQALMFQKDGSYKMINDEAPSLQENQVLIKVAYSPVSNFDKACLTLKKESEKKECEGHILGSEGSGIIEEIGPGVDQSLKGRKVAFCHGGWSQYTIQDLNHIIVLEDHVDLRSASMAIINPLTAICLKYIVRDSGEKSVVFEGANSSLGRLFIKCCMKKDIQCLALVRTQDEAKQLREDLKLNTVLFCENNQEFMKDFCSFISQHNTKILIDSVGGETSGCLFEQMPDRSRMILVGNLAHQDLKLCTADLFMHRKKIEGFSLRQYFWSEELNDEKRRAYIRIIQDDFNKNNGELFGSFKVAKEMSLNEYDKAIDMVEQVQHEGKVLLKIA